MNFRSRRSKNNYGLRLKTTNLSVIYLRGKCLRIFDQKGLKIDNCGLRLKITTAYI